MENGRIKIVCDLKPTGDLDKDKLIIPKIIEATKGLHEKNVADINRLFKYYYNETDILAKDKTQQPDINNKVGVAYGNIAVTTLNGYCFANSLTYSSRKVGNEQLMKDFNDSLDDDNYQDKLLKVALNSGICGLAYKYIVPATEEEIAEGIYYKTYADIDPRTTYCVYSASLDEEKTCAISFYERNTYAEDYSVKKKEIVYTVWTKYHQWEFVRGPKGWVNSTYDVDGQKYDAYPLSYKKIPVIQYYRVQDRTGDFEVAMDLINAINVLTSARLDDVQQSVDYVIVLRDIDTESEGALSKIKACLKDGILSFRSIPEAIVQPDVDVLDTKLNQQEVQTLQQYLCDKVEEVLNIPNRNSKASGGDTGNAVESRNGFRSLENKASIITSSILRGENEALSVILAICSNIRSCPFKDLKPKEIDIKDNRNKYENLTNSASAYGALRSAGLNDVTALEVTKLVSDAITVAQMNEEALIKKAERDMELEVERMTKTSQLSNNNEGNSDSADKNKKESDKKGTNTKK